MSSSVGLVGFASWAVFSALRVLSGCLVRAPDCCFGNPFLGAVRGGTGVCSSLTSWHVKGAGWFCLWALYLVEVLGGRACGETVILTWLLGVSHGDTWLFLPDLVEVRDVGACVVRLWSHVVAPVFRELLCLDGPCWMSPLLLGCVLCWLCVWPCVPVRRCALCSAQSVSLLELSRCLVCHVASLVECCNTCLWLLPALCYLVVNSGLRYAVVVLVGAFWWVFLNGTLVVLVEVLPEPVVL
ncbi:hypothetical protein Taro_027442, partial [Colocasia esculenta]|nr:hypothetical protein [Colocasia esculenta]